MNRPEFLGLNVTQVSLRIQPCYISVNYVSFYLHTWRGQSKRGIREISTHEFDEIETWKLSLPSDFYTWPFASRFTRVAVLLQHVEH